MSERGRAVTIMLHRDGDLTSRSVRIPLWLVRTGAIVGAAVVVTVLLSAALYAPIVRTAARVPGLNREIDRLREDNEQVRALATRLEEIEASYEQVRTMLGGDLVPAPPRAFGSQPVARPIQVLGPASDAEPLRQRSLPERWPLDEPGFVTRGTVRNTVDEAHSGLDIAVPEGTPIRATGGGVVRRAGEDPEYGFFVLVAHARGYESMYGHASRLLVQPGDTVAVGEVIALSGSTGRSTAPHLHFEILREGRAVDPRTLVSEGV
jgi:murein DD-endopeptidase MepM/ murein hydrolase activator NlpD